MIYITLPGEPDVTYQFIHKLLISYLGMFSLCSSFFCVFNKVDLVYL